MKYSELSKEEQKKALEDHSEVNVQSGWTDEVLGKARQKFAEHGVTVHNFLYNLVDKPYAAVDASIDDYRALQKELKFETSREAPTILSSPKAEDNEVRENTVVIPGDPEISEKIQKFLDDANATWFADLKTDYENRKSTEEVEKTLKTRDDL